MMKLNKKSKVKTDALSLWELCDVNPRVINVTVPRRMLRASPAFYPFWINDLRPFDID